MNQQKNQKKQKSLLDKLQDIEDRYACYGIENLTKEDVEAIRQARFLINRMCEKASE